jgi:hypothetical protein
MPDLACEKTLNKTTKGTAAVHADLSTGCSTAVLR